MILYGFGHLQRRQSTRREGIHSIAGYLESEGYKRPFTILPDFGRFLPPLQPDLAGWPIPSLTMLEGTVAGAARWRSFALIPESKQANDPLADVTMEEQFDALLYLGPSSEQTNSQLAPALCRDAEYLQMRFHRIDLTFGMLPPGVRSPADELREYCAAVTQPGQ